MNILEEAAKIGMTELQVNAILGSLLGDASLQKSGKETKSIRWNHGECQSEYVWHKYDLLSEFATREPFSRANPGYGKNWTILTLQSLGLFHSMYSLLHPENVTVKTVTPEFLDQITHPIALAWWFMDDGTKVKNLNTASIYTNGFSMEENELLADWLQYRWGIKATLQQVVHSSTGKQSWQLTLPSCSYPEFAALIDPYVPECMKYKTDVEMQICQYCGKPFASRRNITCCSETCAELFAKESKHRYYEENKEHLRECARKWKAEHREHLNELARARYANMTPEQRAHLNDYAKRWRERNKEKVSEIRKAYRARWKGNLEYERALKEERHRHYERVMQDPERHAHMLELSRLRRSTPEYKAKEREYQRRRVQEYKDAHPELELLKEQRRLERKAQSDALAPEREERRRQRNAARYRNMIDSMTPEQLAQYKLEQKAKNSAKWANRTPEQAQAAKDQQRRVRESWTPEQKEMKSAQKKASAYRLKARRDPAQAEKWTALAEQWEATTAELKAKLA